MDPGDYAFGPLAGFSRVVIVAVQAIATAALIRAGGYHASFGMLVALWLLRPRMIWTSIFLYVAFGVSYRGSATDSFWADLILSLASIPISSEFIVQWARNPSLCWNRYGAFSSITRTFSTNPVLVLAFGNAESAYSLATVMITFLSISIVQVFVLVAFIWKRRLSRGYAMGAFLISLGTFATSWVFWICECTELCIHDLARQPWTSDILTIPDFVLFMNGGFCVTNIGPIAAIHAVSPFISSVLSTWFSNI